MSSPSSLVNTYLSSPRIANFHESSTLTSPLPPFLDKCILATSLLGFNARFIVINFLVLLSNPIQSKPLSNLERQQSILVMKLPMYLFLLLYLHYSISFLVSFSLVYSTLFGVFPSFHGVSFHLPVLLLNTCNCQPLQFFHCCFIQ